MANINCSSCEDLRQRAPSLIVNGLDDDMVTNLKNDLGLVASDSVGDCTALNDMNDCLVGNEAEEVELYEVCDWKTFMKQFIPNLWTTLKAMIAAICGLWTNVETLVDNAQRIDCLIDFLTKGHDFVIGEEETEGSYVVAGKGISFLEKDDSTGGATDIRLRLIAGGFGRLTGSLVWYQEDFEDVAACRNFDNGSVERTTKSRKGNPLFAQTGRPAIGGELLYEVRIKKSAFPQLDTISGGIGHEAAGSAYRVNVDVFREGSYAYGNHGNCNRDGTATDSHDAGHLVPEGWIYVQVRLTWSDAPQNNGKQYSPNTILGIRLNADGIDC